MDPHELSGASHANLDLDGQVWIGAELDELSLEDCSMRRLRASGATWNQCQINSCDLDGADLAGLITRDSSLLGTRLDGSRLTGSSWLRGRWRDLEAEDVAADHLTAFDASWRSVTLRRWRLREADFTNATWRRVRLIECDLTGARFAGLNATDVQITGCTMDGIGGVDSLRGASVAWSDAVSALPALAAHLGITLHDDPKELSR